MPTKEQLIAKANGFVQAISMMKEKERGEPPSHDYGEDYNRLHNMVEQTYGGLRELLPPKVAFVTDKPSANTRSRYAEILAYCQQLVNLIGCL